MRARTRERAKAISLRQEGRTYNEILSEIPVAKSTLSLWLRSVQLAKPQRQRITAKRIEAQRRAAQRKREIRIEETARIQRIARSEIGRISLRECWLIGTALYWAEGSKEKMYRTGSRVHFSNTDPAMIRLFVRWLLACCDLDRTRIVYELYIHESHRFRTQKIMEYWTRVVRIPQQALRIYYKRSHPSPHRKNIGEQYFGTIRVTVRSSTNLNREITGWIHGIVAAMPS